MGGKPGTGWYAEDGNYFHIDESGKYYFYDFKKEAYFDENLNFFFDDGTGTYSSKDNFSWNDSQNGGDW